MSGIEQLCIEIEHYVAYVWRTQGAPISAYTLNRLYCMRARRQYGVGMSEVSMALRERGVVEGRSIGLRAATYYAPRASLAALSYVEVKLFWLAAAEAHKSQLVVKKKKQALPGSRAGDRAFRRRFTQSHAEHAKELREIEAVMDMAKGTYSVFSSHPENESEDG